MPLVGVRTLETLWQMFKDKIGKGVELLIPSKTTKPRDSQPWIDGKLKCKICLRDRAFKKCKKHNIEDDEKKFQQLKRGPACKNTRPLLAVCGGPLHSLR